MGNLAYYCFLIVVLLSCQREGPEAVDLRVSFSCEQAGIMVDPVVAAPGVYALVNDFKVKLAEWSTCTVLSPDVFPAALPPQTTAAVRSDNYLLWAVTHAASVDFYTARDSELEAADFSRIATYGQGRFDLLRPLHPADLAGYYTYAGTDTSYVLFLGSEGGRLISKLFATTETLPADKMLQRALPSFAATPELPFAYDVNTLDFRGPLGSGHLHWRPDSVQLRFDIFLEQKREISFTVWR